MERKPKVILPLWCLDRDLILEIRHAYFRGISLKNIAHENGVEIEDVESVIDAMNL